ncbi:MAG: hypothetical protein GX034_04505 [Clostridiaceae bacterium]|jgi:hypothetical protein|nr:hypothetical protein [Clostridiaceae bacterium]
MDYLEGSLIGPIWSDTEYKKRRHLGAHIILSVLMLLFFVLSYLRPQWTDRFIFVPYPGSLVFLIILVLLTPLLSSFYYRLPLAIRPLLLILYMFKYILLFYILLHFFLPLVPEQIDDASVLVLERMDNHISASIGFFEFAGSLFGMILGIVAGGLWVVLEMLLIVALLLTVPLLSFGLIRGIQYLLDFTYKKYVFQPIIDGKKRKRRAPGIRQSPIEDLDSHTRTRIPVQFPRENDRDSDDSAQ